MTELADIEFRECLRCHGYGVLDNGNCCHTCGGAGKRTPFDDSGTLGCGDMMYDKKTGRRITYAEFSALARKRSDKLGVMNEGEKQ